MRYVAAILTLLALVLLVLGYDHVAEPFGWPRLQTALVTPVLNIHPAEPIKAAAVDTPAPATRPETKAAPQSAEKQDPRHRGTASGGKSAQPAPPRQQATPAPPRPPRAQAEPASRTAPQPVHRKPVERHDRITGKYLPRLNVKWEWRHCARLLEGKKADLVAELEEASFVVRGDKIVKWSAARKELSTRSLDCTAQRNQPVMRTADKLFLERYGQKPVRYWIVMHRDFDAEYLAPKQAQALEANGIVVDTSSEKTAAMVTHGTFAIEGNDIRYIISRVDNGKQHFPWQDPEQRNN